MKTISLFCLLYCLIQAPSVHAQKINILIGLEPFPPLIKEDNSGYCIELLKAIEKHSNVTFEIKILPFNRIKYELIHQKIDMGGLTVVAGEEKRFYEHVDEIEWQLVSKSDLYVIHPEKLQQNLNQLKIGTPRGSEVIASRALNIPRVNIYSNGTPTSLLRMLAANRLDGFWFDRVVTMSTIDELSMPTIYYERHPKGKPLRVTLNVIRTERGALIKRTIDNTLAKIDISNIFAPYIALVNLPSKGAIKAK